jgi:hypothetical protein
MSLVTNLDMLEDILKGRFYEIQWADMENHKFMAQFKTPLNIQHSAKWNLTAYSPGEPPSRRGREG